jgi:hypothetical protein
VAHLGLVLVAQRGRWKARRGSSAAPGVGHHGGGEFRRGRGEVGQRAAGEASMGSQGGAGWLDGEGMKGNAPFTEQHPWWPATGHEAVGGGGSRAARLEQRLPFNATRALACDRRADGDVPRGGRRPR